MKMSGRGICNKVSHEYAYYSKVKKYGKRRANPSRSPQHQQGVRMITAEQVIILEAAYLERFTEMFKIFDKTLLPNTEGFEVLQSIFWRGVVEPGWIPEVIRELVESADDSSVIYDRYIIPAQSKALKTLFPRFDDEAVEDVLY